MQNRQQTSEQAFLAQNAGKVPDLSTLGRKAQAAQRDLTSQHSNPLTGHDPGQLTPTEENLCIAAQMRLNDRWLAKLYDRDMPDGTWDRFANDARNEFGKIGFVIDIMWSEVEGDKSEGLTGVIALPQITILGRVDKRDETDHELVKREVGAGLKDGKAGYVREDGSWHEDPIRKTI